MATLKNLWVVFLCGKLLMAYGNNAGLLIVPTICITVLYQFLIFNWS